MNNPKTAIFIVHNADLTNIAHIARIATYDLIVAVPSINMTKLREINPEATVLAYYDMTTIPSYGSNEGFYGRMREVMSEHRLQRQVAIDGSTVRQIVTNSYGNYELQLTFDAYYALAKWINENTDPGLDGPYLDQCWSQPPEIWVEATGRSKAETVRRWPLIRDYFIGLLPSTTPIVGNVGSRALIRTSTLLGGISVESGHPAWIAKAFAKYNPDLCVNWGGLGYDGLCLTGERLPGR